MYSTKVKLGVTVMKLVNSLLGLDVMVIGRGPECYLTLILLNKIPVPTIRRPE